jgi:hypothetical protein
MARYVFLLQPGVIGPIEKPVDLVHHATERVPADISLQIQAVYAEAIPDLVTEYAGPMLLDDLDFYKIRSLHDFSPMDPCTPLPWIAP